MKYQPVGKKVLLKILPPKKESAIIIPEHLKKANVTGEQQFFHVEALGPAAVDKDHPLEVGQTVMISAHPTLLIGIDAAEALCECNNNDIACICTDDQLEMTLN